MQTARTFSQVSHRLGIIVPGLLTCFLSNRHPPLPFRRVLPARFLRRSLSESEQRPGLVSRTWDSWLRGGLEATTRSTVTSRSAGRWIAPIRRADSTEGDRPTLALPGNETSPNRSWGLSCLKQWRSRPIYPRTARRIYPRRAFRIAPVNRCPKSLLLNHLQSG